MALVDIPDEHLIGPLVTMLRRVTPDLRIVTLWDMPSPTQMLEAVAVGIDGCIGRSRSPRSIAETLRLVALGERALLPDPALFAAWSEGATNSNHNLSPREVQLLSGLVRGYGNKELAREFGITEATVKIHLKNLMRKTGAVNRTQAAVWALEQRLVSADGVPVQQAGSSLLSKAMA